jgi:hypothetical protein
MNLINYAASEMTSSLPSCGCANSDVVPRDTAGATWNWVDRNMYCGAIATDASVSQCPTSVRSAGRSIPQPPVDLQRLRGERFRGVNGAMLRRMTRQDFIEHDADCGSMLYDRVQLLLAARCSGSNVLHRTADVAGTITPQPFEIGKLVVQVIFLS